MPDSNKRPRVCNVPECGRPLYARGMCQTHSRQQRVHGRVREITRHRPRRKGAVKVTGGLSLSPDAAGVVKQAAQDRGLTVYQLVTDILEEWAGDKNRSLDDG
ncbi:MAG TPA: hypothetical protein VK447_20540 [Myxococcaceae bacterium]|nr:hypothetical protein [Myxococcaceae bacterium]